MLRPVITTFFALGLAASCASHADFKSSCTRALEPELPPKVTARWSKLEVETLHRFVEVRGQLELTGRLPGQDASSPAMKVRSYFACQIDANGVVLARSLQPIPSFSSRLEAGQTLQFARARGKGTPVDGPAPLVTREQVQCAQKTARAANVAFARSIKILRPSADESPDFAEVFENLSAQAEALAKIDTSACSQAVRKAIEAVETAFTVHTVESVGNLAKLEERGDVISDAVVHHSLTAEQVLRAAGQLVF